MSAPLLATDSVASRRFERRSALITGAGSGIGRAVALRLAAEGARVFLVDSDRPAVAETAALTGDVGPAADFTVADVRDAGAVERYVDQAASRLGQLDCFFNNAGVTGPIVSLTEYPVAAFDDVIAVNLRGVFLGLRQVMTVMREQQGGSIVNTSSVAGLTGHVGHAGYVASKHAVVGLTKVAAAEAASTPIRVNAVCPGPTDTAMIQQIETMKSPQDPSLERERITANIPAGRYGTARETAAAVAFLLSDDASYITGTTLVVDGGFISVH